MSTSALLFNTKTSCFAINHTKIKQGRQGRERGEGHQLPPVNNSYANQRTLPCNRPPLLKGSAERGLPGPVTSSPPSGGIPDAQNGLLGTELRVTSAHKRH